MKKSVYLNGDFVPVEKATVSVMDRGFLYGDGIFETIRAYGGVPFRWKKHFERMAASAQTLGIEFNRSDGELRESVTELLARNELKDAYLRISLSRGIHHGDLGLSPNGVPTLVITAGELNRPSDEEYENGVSAIILSRPCTSPLASHKTLSYLPYLAARHKANEVGARETLLCGPAGRMTEGTSSNLFIVLSDRVFTPPDDGTILPGITRKTVMDALHASGIECMEDYFTSSEVYDADEVFITNSIIETLPVTRIGKAPVHNGKVGPIFKKALAAYRGEVRKELEGQV